MMKTDVELSDRTAWLGAFVAVHRIGEYEIVEYHPRKVMNNTLIKDTEAHVQFSVPEDGRSYDTLDQALIGSICRKYDGINERLSGYIVKALGMETA